MGKRFSHAHIFQHVIQFGIFFTNNRKKKNLNLLYGVPVHSYNADTQTSPVMHLPESLLQSENHTAQSSVSWMLHPYKVPVSRFHSKPVNQAATISFLQIHFGKGKISAVMDKNHNNLQFDFSTPNIVSSVHNKICS